MDQFFNILRDLQEDAEQGICYFPIELMQHFGVTRDEILSLNALENPGYYRMMKFLLDEYLPVLYQKVHQLTHAKTLHPSWEILRAWSLHRYQRIEYTFRQSRFDYSQFPRLYWPKVAQELPGLLSNLQRQLKSTNQEPQLKSSPFSLLPNFSKLTTIQVA